MALHCDRERGTGPTVALLHGFSQNTRCWGPFRKLLETRIGASHQVVGVDLPGHGRSGHDDAGLDRTAELVADAVGTATYVGYSMGGRVALHAALANPERVERLVMIGATAGLDSEAERTERRELDEQRAQRLEQIGLPEFMAEWLALPLFAGIPEGANHLGDRLQNRSDGLAASLRNCGTGTQRSLWSELDQLAMPVTVIAGEHDTKFRRVADRLGDAIGANASVVTIAGSGHTCQLERAELTAAAVATAICGELP